MNLQKTFIDFVSKGWRRSLGLSHSRQRPMGQAKEQSLGYFLYRYEDGHGSFDYAAYKNAQIAANQAKINKVWATRDNISFMADYLKKNFNTITFGICHGTRRGLEQLWFREFLGCEVIGTEISPTANDFPFTIQMDFHDLKPDWIGKADFVYSNSFDHTYDPKKCLEAWVATLKPGGVCLLEMASKHGHSGATKTDPFEAEVFAMPYLIATWSNGKFGVVEALDVPCIRRKRSVQKVFVVKRAEISV